MQNWRKTGLCFQKWDDEFDNFSPEHLKISKLGLWWDAFIQSRKFISLKFTLELCHDNEEWCNLKRNWLVSSKLTWRIWWILTWALENLKNLHFNRLLLTNVKFLSLESTEELSLMAMKIDAFKNGTNNLENVCSPGQK